MTQAKSKKSKLKTHWNLKLLYQSPTDPQIEADLKHYKEKRQAFAKKYQNQADYLTNEDQLLAALTDYQELLNQLNGARPLMYFHYLSSLKTGDQSAQAKLNKLTNQLTKAYNQLTFFPIKLGKIDPAYQEKFLKSDKLKPFHYLLERRFLLAKYDLKEEQEKILNLTDQTGQQMWVKGVEKSLHQKTVKFQGQELPLAAASCKIPELSTKPRRELHQKLLKKASQVTDFAEAELNAIITHKKISDELRGFKQPYQQTILANENNEQIILDLVDLITKNFNLAHRFYQVKAKLLKLDKLTYADRAAKLDSFNQKYSFDQTYQLIKKTFKQLDPQFSQILTSMTKQGQLDVFPKKGKVGGAFCSSSTNNPTYVLLNHTDDFNSATTMAHELGHALHSELSKTQPVIYQSYSASTAETASTFFEQLVFEQLIQDFSQEQKIVALHNQLQDDINTIFRQIALFNFELQLHQQVRKQGYLGAQQIGQLLNQHTQAYLGNIFKLTNQDGQFFILWPHLRYFFYTYTYAYGHLISKALVRKVKTQPEFIKKVVEFLQAGGSDTPENIFKKIGIEIAKPDFFKTGLAEVEAGISELEKLV